MVVEGPEVLHCVECDDGALVVVPVSRAVVAEKPQRPRVLKENFKQNTLGLLRKGRLQLL